MAPISKLPSPSIQPQTSRPAASPSQPVAPTAPRAESRVARPVDGFDAAPSNLVDRPGRGKLVDRPTGLRPGSPQIQSSSEPSALRPLTSRKSLAAATETLSAQATPNLPVKDLEKVTSSVSFDKDVSIDSLKLSLDLPHTYQGDLVVSLTSPSGKTATVHDRTGGGKDDLKGSFDLSAFKGEKTQGTWTLTVEDKARADTGTLKSWGLEATGKVGGVDPKPTPSGEPIIAVFDGGVDYKHTDLDEAMWRNPGEVAGDGIDNDGNGYTDDIHGFNVGFDSGDPMKGAGTDHGTHVAGIIASEDNGQGSTGVAAGKAKVLSVGGLYDGKDLLTNFERAVDYVVDQKARGANIRAVNASFGDEYRDAASQARWKAAVQKLADADILLVAATANGNGSNMNNVQDFPANVDMPNVITVASMDRNNDKLARFSSHGDKVVELAAVGEDVLSTVPGGRWDEMSGTSMATPRVAATAALMFAENPNLTAAQVRDLLVKTVELDPDLKGKVSTGGKLDIAAAVAAAKAAATNAFASR
ncbi:S8 family serine peptidase [Hyalangium gracile]|uniref:S8 family serine peptidase n=1 Tax=Hyalangium gracile TaxID=394092 RepID=UPI001CCA2D83|nr:S8 family serine peptidase [Hyalangium gracile]